MTRSRRVANVALCALAASVVSLTSDVSAQAPPSLQPVDAPTLRADAYSIGRNPANLTFLNGLHSAFAVNTDPSTADATRLGWYTAWGLGRIVGIGAGVDRSEDATVTTLGIAGGTRRFSVGVSSHRYRSTDILDLDGHRTTTVSSSVRFTPTVGAALAIHNPARPRLGGVPMDRVVVPSLAVQTRSARLGLDVSAHIVDAEVVRVGSAVVSRPVDGLRLFAGAWANPTDGARDFGGYGGFELSFGSSMNSVSAGGSGAGGLDLTVTAEISVAGTPALFRRSHFLRVDLAGDLREVPQPRLIRGDSTPFVELLASLHQVAVDPHFDGVFLNMGGLTAGVGQLHELRAAVQTIQAQGKTVIAYFERASVRDLYVAGGADFRAAAPSMNVLTTGIGVTRYYFADLLQSVGIRAEFVRLGDYKSGPERFTESTASPQASEQLDRYLDTVWSTLQSGIAENFGLSEAETAALLESGALTPETLSSRGLLEHIGFRDDLQEVLTSRLGHRISVVTAATPDVRDGRWADPNVVAVLHVSGAIVHGRSGDTLFGYATGSGSIEEACRALAADSEVRAVIVRIDSPGGSATASDAMHNALRRLAESKFVVVSMGDVAASGGIYVASFGAPIHASPTTLTGSIGVYAGTFALDDLLVRAGVTRLRDERGGPSDLFDGRSWDERARAAVYSHIEAAYRLFIRRVAEGRGVSESEIEAIAAGRIYSGSDAQGNGLVDDLGGFASALDGVRRHLGLNQRAPVTLRHYPRPRASVASLLPNLPSMRADASSIDWSDVLSRLGLGPVLRALLPALQERAGAPMAQLEWVILDD